MKFVLLLLLFISFSLLAHDKVPEIVLLGDDNYPPYSYKDKDGSLKGIYPEIIREASKKIKDYTIKLESIPWKRGLIKLDKPGNVGLFPPYFRPMERTYMWPYSLPILEEEAIVLCRKDITLPVAPNWPQDFTKFKIGLQRGFSTGGEEFSKLVEQKKMSKFELSSIKAALKVLSKNRIQCYLNDRLSIFWTINEMVKEGELTEKDAKSFIEVLVISRERGFVGYSHLWNPEYKIDFLKKFDHAIHLMRKDGRIYEIQKKYSGGR